MAIIINVKWADYPKFGIILCLPFFNFKTFAALPGFVFSLFLHFKIIDF